MDTKRLEAFSDGVLAIIITIMVLELKVPHGVELAPLKLLVPIFLSYVLSFIYVGIYWNNHHHMFQVSHHVNGAILWANLHLLFWLSLIPFVTGWMGENHFSALPSALYGAVLMMAALAYWILQKAMLHKHGHDSVLAKAIGKKDFKGIISPVLYAVGIFASFFHPHIGQGFYLLVALMWLVPDTRFEKALSVLENKGA